MDLDTLGPLVAAPHSPGNVVPLADAVGTPVEQVYIGNCANGTITDLRQAADVLRGRSVHRAIARGHRPCARRRSTARR